MVRHGLLPECFDDLCEDLASDDKADALLIHDEADETVEIGEGIGL